LKRKRGADFVKGGEKKAKNVAPDEAPRAGKNQPDRTKLRREKKTKSSIRAEARNARESRPRKTKRFSTTIYRHGGETRALIAKGGR